MIAQTYLMGPDRPLLGFWGKATDDLISSLGVVGADKNCIPIPGLHDSSSDSLSTGGIVGITFGSLAFATIVGAIVFVCIKLGLCKKEQIMKIMKKKDNQN